MRRTPLSCGLIYWIGLQLFYIGLWQQQSIGNFFLHLHKSLTSKHILLQKVQDLFFLISKLYNLLYILNSKIFNTKLYSKIQNVFFGFENISQTLTNSRVWNVFFNSKNTFRTLEVGLYFKFYNLKFIFEFKKYISISKIQNIKIIKIKLLFCFLYGGAGRNFLNNIGLVEAWQLV